MKHNLALPLVALLAMALTPVAASAQQAVLLTVDVSDPSNVVISATGTGPLINDSSAIVNRGVTLRGLFDADFDGERPLAGDLAPRDAPAFDLASNDFDAVTARDLNLFRSAFSDGTTTTQAFVTTDAAFTGAGTIDLSGASFVVGTVGDISVGDTIDGDTTGGSGATLGQFQVVVPEPSSLALLGLGGAALLRRRRA